MVTEIRLATPADAATVASLGRTTFAETFGYLFTGHPDDLAAYLDATFGVAKIEHSLGQPQNAFWLALRDRLPIGYAKLKCPSPPPGQGRRHAAQLQKLYLLRDFPGQGIGADLLAQAMRSAQALAALTWLDVLQENHRAIRFYARHGFVAAGADSFAIGAQRFHFTIMTRASA